MNNFNWYFPKTEIECIDLMNDGYRPHGGGTFLVKTSLNIKGLFDLSNVKELKKAEKDDSFVILGSALSYHDASNFLNKNLPGCFLASALGSAASTPLRNRITLGGSICAAPKWSDIISPLSAASASVIIAGKKEEVSYSQYAADRNLRKNTLVCALKIPVQALAGDYYRFTVTGFDYPLFSIAVSDGVTDKKTCAVSGSSGGVMTFKGSREEILTAAGADLQFHDERGMTGEYIKTRAVIELGRMVKRTGASNE